ncbi:MAG: hypothetical protein HC772_09855, partial [Leptolyngbyaceae cyanobacterium CRU_2_3]|nr:hypothetical protein [Leptolyngbyaceae cyanobacterium CRU_2_3]
WTERKGNREMVSGLGRVRKQGRGDRVHGKWRQITPFILPCQFQASVFML